MQCSFRPRSVYSCTLFKHRQIQMFRPENTIHLTGYTSHHFDKRNGNDHGGSNGNGSGGFGSGFGWNDDWHAPSPITSQGYF